MAADDLKVGDIVVLKSGGPAMTVVRVSDNGTHVTTAWFAGKKKEDGVFPIEAVEQPREEKEEEEEDE